VPATPPVRGSERAGNSWRWPIQMQEHWWPWR
jgi:hypothetical protein